MFREAKELLRANKPNHAKYLEGLGLSRSREVSIVGGGAGGGEV